MKKVFIKVSVITLACLFVLTSLFGCQPNNDNGNNQQNEPGQEQAHAVVTLTDFDGAVPLISKAYSDYLERDYADIKNESTDYSYGQVDLAYEIDFDEGYIGKYLYLYMGQNSDMSDKVELTEIIVSGKEAGSYPVYNLLPATTYYWKAKLVYHADGQMEEKTVESDTHSFITDDAIPYTYFVEGVTNVREMGGYPTNDGKTVKRGMLFRSGKLNSIKKNGLKTYTDLLKIKTEIDLRIENEPCPSLLGIDYIYCGMNSSSTYDYFPSGKSWTGQSCYITFNLEAIKKFFDALADESNYPINYHCSIGTDRTGCVAFLVEALLDVEEEWIYRDYLLSNYAKIDKYNRVAKHVDSYKNLMGSQAGATLAERTYNYLSNVVGVSTQNLDKIISLLKV